MALPTIVFFDHHYDLMPRQVISALLPDLVGLGYDTLCVEAPQDMSAEVHIRAMTDKIKFSEETRNLEELMLPSFHPLDDHIPIIQNSPDKQSRPFRTTGSDLSYWSILNLRQKTQ